MSALVERITEALSGRVLTKPELAQTLGIDPTASPITDEYRDFSTTLQDLRDEGTVFIATDPNEERVKQSGGEFARYYRKADEKGMEAAGILKKHTVKGKGRVELEDFDLLTTGEESGVISQKVAQTWRDFFAGKTRKHPSVHPPRAKR